MEAPASNVRIERVDVRGWWIHLCGWDLCDHHADYSCLSEWK